MYLDAPQRTIAAIRKITKLAPAPHIPSPPEPSIVLRQATPIPFEGLPAIHSLDWQLQYPPGGSTHASYPFPSLDPRLIFHQPFVPLNNGLPDVSKVPKLVLPMGWRHVSWSGLLPIAFDPYHQAFKLTPVGPMPLTCEELHQGGLHKYVPGGELHPETALLPQMMALSDGSDGEVYNFEGVDWVLPWTEINNALGCQSSSTQYTTASSTNTSTSPEFQLAVAAMAPSHYVEGWDCPDTIIDLEDAWRWLAENEKRCTPAFEPTAGKTWRGTGMHCTTRKIKQPLASLMALNMAATSEDNNNYLVNQNGREFCPFKSIATPVHVDITLLKNVEITLVELLSYFPNHFQWRKGADRLVRSGLSASDIANLINMTRCLSGNATRNKGAVNEHLCYKYETLGSRKRVRIVRDERETTTSYTTEGWTYTVWVTTDYPLLGLAHGLKNLPTGPDAGPLTAMIEWCREKGRCTTMLGDVSDLLKEANIQPLIEPGESGCPDKEVLARFVEVLKTDRKRVLQCAGDKKRAAEGSMVGKGNKKKRYE